MQLNTATVALPEAPQVDSTVMEPHSLEAELDDEIRGPDWAAIQRILARPSPSAPPMEISNPLYDTAHAAAANNFGLRSCSVAHSGHARPGVYANFSSDAATAQLLGTDHANPAATQTEPLARSMYPRLTDAVAALGVGAVKLQVARAAIEEDVTLRAQEGLGALAELSTSIHALLATAGRSTEIRLFDSRAPSLGTDLGGHRENVACLCALEGGMLASGDGEGAIRVWRPRSSADGQTGDPREHGHVHRQNHHSADETSTTEASSPHFDCVATVSAHARGIRALTRISAGGSEQRQYLISGSWDRTIKVWRVDAFSTASSDFNGHQVLVQQLQELRLPSMHATACLCPLTIYAGAGDGAIERLWFASGSDDGMVRVWSAAAESQSPRTSTLTSTPWNGARLHEQPSRAERTTYASTSHAKLTPDPSFVLVQELRGHATHIHALVQLTDGRMVSASNDDHMLVWAWSAASSSSPSAYPLNTSNSTIGSFVCVQQLPSAPAYSLAALSDSRFASGHADGTITMWSSSSCSSSTAAAHHDREQHLHQWPLIPVHAGAGASGGVMHTAMPSASAMPALPIHRSHEMYASNTVHKQSGFVRCLLVLRDGRMASASIDGTVVLHARARLG